MEILRQIGRPFGFKNKQWESLTEQNVAGFKIRIWRTAKTLEAAKAFNHAQMKEHMRQIATSLPRDNWEEALMKLPKVACVAITNADGDGVSVYPDWG